LTSPNASGDDAELGHGDFNVVDDSEFVRPPPRKGGTLPFKPRAFVAFTTVLWFSASLLERTTVTFVRPFVFPETSRKFASGGVGGAAGDDEIRIVAIAQALVHHPPTAPTRWHACTASSSRRRVQTERP
jgi:hypothetical protein